MITMPDRSMQARYGFLKMAAAGHVPRRFAFQGGPRVPELRVVLFRSHAAFPFTCATVLCLKSRKSLLDRVSTGSGSDLVSDPHAIFPNDF